MDLNNLFSGVSLTLPGWAFAAAGLGVVLLLILVLRPRNDTSGLATLAQLALVAVVAGAGYFGLKQYEDNSRFAERNALEERAALLSQAHQPGSVLACLNVSVIPVLDEACEKIIFAEPQRITSAIAVTADRLAFLYDAVAYSAREPAYADRFEPLRKTLEADPYGIVAYVLAAEFKCIPDSCARLRMFKNSERVKANLAYRKFDDLLNKHKTSWAKVNDQPGEVSDILTLGIRPQNNTALKWGSEDGETPPASFVPQTANTEPPSAAPAVRPNEPPVSPAKQKAAPAKQKQQPAATEQKKQPPATQARKKGGPPDPVGGLPRVLGRRDPATLPQADDDEDDTPPAPTPPPAAQQNRSPFGIFNR
jgi:hypothetical protein